MVHWGWQVPAEQKSPHGQSLVRAQVRPPSLSFGCGPQVPEMQAGPLTEEPPSLQSQLVLHCPAARPELPLPLLLWLLVPPLLLLLLLLLLPGTPQVPLRQTCGAEHSPPSTVQRVQTPVSQLPPDVQSASVEQGMVVPESVVTAVLGLQETAKAAAAKATGMSLRMAASLRRCVRGRNYR